MTFLRAAHFALIFGFFGTHGASASVLSFDLTLVYQGEGFTRAEVYSAGNSGSEPDLFGPGFLAGEDNIWGLTGAFSHLSTGDEVRFSFAYDSAGDELESCIFAGLSCMPDISPSPPDATGNFRVSTFQGAPGGWRGGDFIIRGNVNPGEVFEAIVLYNDGGVVADEAFFALSLDYEAYFQVKPAVVPAPSSLPLLGSGLFFAMALLRRRKIS